MQTDRFLVAVAQSTPCFLDGPATVEKACGLIEEAGKAGARLLVFPEAYLPTYPFWVWLIPPGKTRILRPLYDELLRNSVCVPDAAVERLCAAAAAAKTTVAIGINEVNAEASGTTLYNTLLWIDHAGRVIGAHRKLVPTAAERLIHGMGDGSTLQVFAQPFAKLSGLICWENYMPLARYALYAWGAQIHLAPTWDCGEPWWSTLRHIAKEGRAYVIGCCSAVHRNDIPDHFEFKHEYLSAETEWINRGGSAVADPDGKWLLEPVVEQENLMLVEIDPAATRGPRFQLDVAGHYARPDIFRLSLRRQAQEILSLEPPASEEAIAEEDPDG